MPGFFSALNTFVMGKRPHNTIFSFNYHNISHIVRFINASKKALPQGKLSFIDIGGGAAPYYELFQESIGEYTVVDVDNILAKDDPRGIKFVKSFAEELPFGDSAFDVVLSNQVLEHVLDPSKAVAESFRVLKPGGYLIGSVPHISPIHLEPYDFRRFTELGVKKIFEENGFNNIKIDGNTGAFRTAAFMVLMDMTLSKRTDNQPQRFYTKKHFLMFPFTGFINISAVILDAIFGDKKRSPSNYCWIARKP